jgi:hypothetical protein
MRADPNGTDPMLGDKERRFMEIFLECAEKCPLFSNSGRRMYKMNSEWRI